MKNKNREYRITLTNQNAGKLELYHLPEGWKKCGWSFNRDNKYYGMFKKYAVSELGFVKEGKAYIKRALGVNGDDFEQKITILIEKYNFDTYAYEEDFKGELSLVDYKEDKLTATLPVGDLSFEEKFLTRSDVDVDLSTLTTIDGLILPSFTREKQFIELPSRQDTLNNTLKVSEEYEYTQVSLTEGKATIALALNKDIGEDNNVKSTDQQADSSGAFYVNNNLTDKQIDVKGDVILYTSTIVGNPELAENVRLVAKIYDLNDIELKEVLLDFQINSTAANQTNQAPVRWDITTRIVGNVDFTETIPVGGYVLVGLAFNTGVIAVTVDQGASGNIIANTKRDALEEQTVEVKTVHEAFTRIAQVITNNINPFFSTILGRTNSELIKYDFDGEASKTALTNGKLIRGFSNTEAPLTASLDDLFKSLQTNYKLGLGVETINGNKTIRCENIDYFYDPRIAFTIEGVKNIKRTFDKSKIYNKIELGYVKGESDEKREGIFDYNNKTKWSNIISTFDKTFRMLSPYSASNLGITEARKLQKNIDPTKDSKYDEINYLIDLVKNENPNLIVNGDFESELLFWEVGPDTELVNIFGSNRVEIGWIESSLYSGLNQIIDIIDTPTLSFSYTVIDEQEHTYLPQFEIRAKYDDGIAAATYYRLDSDGYWVEGGGSSNLQSSIKGVKRNEIQEFKNFSITAKNKLSEVVDISKITEYLVSFDSQFIKDSRTEATFIVDDISISDGAEFKARTTEGFEKIEGLINNTESYNINLSPANAFYRWGSVLRAFLENQLNSVYTFSKSDKNSSMLSKKTDGLEIVENANINVNDLDEPIWSSKEVSFEGILTHEQIRDLQGNYTDGKPKIYGLVKFKGEGMQDFEYLYIDKLKVEGRNVDITGILKSKYVEVAEETAMLDDDFAFFTDDDNEIFYID